MVSFIMLLVLIVSCTTKKNTSATRAYHALTAHYNTLYNGQVAYQEGFEAQSKGHKDNFNEILPMYICTNGKHGQEQLRDRHHKKREGHQGA